MRMVRVRYILLYAYESNCECNHLAGRRVPHKARAIVGQHYDRYTVGLHLVQWGRTPGHCEMTDGERSEQREYVILPTHSWLCWSKLLYSVDRTKEPFVIAFIDGLLQAAITNFYTALKSMFRPTLQVSVMLSENMSNWLADSNKKQWQHKIDTYIA